MSFGSREKSVGLLHGQTVLRPLNAADLTGGGDATPTVDIADVPPLREGNPFGYNLAVAAVPAIGFTPWGLWQFVYGDVSAEVDGQAMIAPTGETGSNGAWLCVAVYNQAPPPA